MKVVVLLFCFLLSCPLLHAGENGKPVAADLMDTAKSGRNSLNKSTANGEFMVEMALPAKDLKQGPNVLDITVRDRNGTAVRGAELTVTPWMPMMGHGVWDKPEVTERSDGSYHVENVKIIMNGLWELKVTVRKGAQEDRTSFGFYVAEQEPAPPAETEKPREGIVRIVKNYVVPNVTLLNQDGKRVNLKTLIDSGKPVVVNFIFTTCTTICPVLSAGFSSIQRELGDQAADRVQLISITIDPEHDRPEQLKEYGSRFDAGKGWDFLTGTREDIGKVLTAFDAFVTDKMSHEPLYIFRSPNSGEWVRVKGLAKKSELLKEFRRIEKK